MCSTDEKSESCERCDFCLDRLPLVYKESGKPKVNFKKLKSLVESCGFPFIKRKGFPLTPEFTRKDESVVFFLSPANCTFFQHVYADHFKIRKTPHLGALLHFGKGLYYLDEKSGKRKPYICHWLNDCIDCLVCFDKIVATQVLKKIEIGCFCGATLCFGCFIDMLLSSEPRMTLVCPNCRRYTGPMLNFEATFNILALGRKSLKSMNAEQIDFLESQMGFDLDSHWPVRGSPEHLHLTRLIEDIPKKFKVDDSSTVVEEITQLKKLKEMLCLRRTKKGGASAGGSSAVDVSNGGCAKCGKAFWDKSEWKRAPKCPKCKRTAYCSAKCRKSHRKVHATLCSPKATKQTLKANGKRKRRCAP